jgi:hypothetical protein
VSNVWTSRAARWWRRSSGAATIALCAIVLAAPARTAAAQATTDSAGRGPLLGFINLDRLRLGALGVDAGRVAPSNVESTMLYGLHADYGEIFPKLRLLFGVSYWGSRYTRETVGQFRKTLLGTIQDPSGDDTVNLGRVTLSDVTLSTDLRYLPTLRWAVRPYVGAGVTVNVLNAEGRAISGTFVESALDNINAGMQANVGAELVAFTRIGVGAQARYDLLSGARFASVRLTGTYYFDRSARSGVVGTAGQ